MKKDWKYIFYLLAAFLVYVGVKLYAPAQLDWSVTFHKEDKDPFGGYALSESLDELFPGKNIKQSYYTLYELYDSLREPVNFISLSTTFSPGKEDVDALLKNIEQGGSAFIAAQYFYGDFADTLNLSTSDYFFETQTRGYIDHNDTARISFVNPALAQTIYNFPRKNTHNYFDSFDSTRTSILAKNDLELAVMVNVKWGKGKLIVCSVPLAFTNIYLLKDDHYKFCETTLSHLPVQDVIWTEYYHLGRMESQTPLRFVLTNEPLRWAYFITIFSILIYMIFEAKRKQRIIPVIKPLANTTLEFVNTIGNLYYQSAEHKSIATKKINFLLEQIRSKYWLSTTKLDSAFTYALARKSGNTDEVVESLIKAIVNIQSKSQVSAEELMALNEKIEAFHSMPGSRKDAKEDRKNTR